MVSSYAATREGAILSTADGIPDEAGVYRVLLREILGEIESSADHPKISNVIKDALDAAEQDEKTLIFCARNATLEQLRPSWMPSGSRVSWNDGAVCIQARRSVRSRFSSTCLAFGRRILDDDGHGESEHS